eukprot:7892372-Pyramimonas_sp.AAC.1
MGETPVEHSIIPRVLNSKIDLRIGQISLRLLSNKRNVASSPFSDYYSRYIVVLYQQCTLALIMCVERYDEVQTLNLTCHVLRDCTTQAVFPSSVGVIYKGEEPVTDGDDKRTPKKESKDGEDAEMKDASATETSAEAKERERTYYVNQMGYRRDHMEVMGPYGKDGLIKDWDIMEQLWDHTLRKSLM